MECLLYIQNGDTIYQPALKDDVKWTTERKGSPGKLTFTVINDSKLNIQEGNPIKLIIDGQNCFYGYIFKKQRSDYKEISITAYDQLRYFKNKDTYSYVGKKASELLAMICSDFNLNTGTIEDTEYIISQKVMSNKTLFDIMQDALDTTMTNANKIYVLYDDFGAISLQNISSMKVPILIDADTGESFEYTSSIDDQTYNQIKLTYDNSDTGKRDIYMTKDSSNINEWGVLQYFDELDEGENGQEKASKLLEYYNQKTRKLSISDAFGDIRVRAGTSVLVKMVFDDITVNNFMVVDSVTHNFKNGLHTMDLQLQGGTFIV